MVVQTVIILHHIIFNCIYDHINAAFFQKKKKQLFQTFVQ